MIGISEFFFPGFKTVPGHVTGLPTIVAVSPKPAGVALSCYSDNLAGFILLRRRPPPPFTVYKYIQCELQCLGTTVLTIYVNVVHVNPHLRVYYLV